MYKNRRKETFEQILLDALDQSLLSLGERVKTSVYHLLEQKFALPKHEIPYRIKDFSDALDQIFGLGARNLEVLIIKNLHQKINCNCKLNDPHRPVSDLTFSKYIDMMQLAYESAFEIDAVETHPVMDKNKHSTR
jgi:hypothetical protein